MELTADNEGGVAKGGESGALVVDVRLQRVRLGALPLDVLLNCEDDVAGLNDLLFKFKIIHITHSTPVSPFPS